MNETEMKREILNQGIFTNNIDSKSFVIYGYKNRALGEFLAKAFSSQSYLVYDKNTPQNAHSEYENLTYTNDWNYVKKIAKDSVLVLPHILQEKHANRVDFDSFVYDVFMSGFSHIVIFDTCLDEISDRLSDINDYVRVLQTGRVINESKLAEFERKRGKLLWNRSLVEYLLTYDKNACDSLFSMNMRELLSIIPKSYTICQYEHYVPYYIKQKIEETFGVDRIDNTHVKMILKSVAK